MLTEVPEYHDRAAADARRFYRDDVQQFERHMQHARFYVADDGVLYERLGVLFKPLWPDEALEPLLPGHRFAYHSAPYRCGTCGTDRLQVISTDAYETTARCPDCDVEQTVHVG